MNTNSKILRILQVIAKAARPTQDLSLLIEELKILLGATVPTISFSGVFSLANTSGTFWSDFIQDGELTLSAGSAPEIGGRDYIKIIADGDGIIIPEEWVNIGTDVIDETDGAINRLTVVKTQTEIQYSVKVEV